MRIAYVIDWDINANSGVLNKITSKIEVWEKEGVEVFLFIISHQTNKTFIPSQIKNVIVIERPAMDFLIIKKLKGYFGRNAAFRVLRNRIRSLVVDVVYFRQNTMWYPQLDHFLSSFPTIMEVNTDDIREKSITANFINRQVYTLGRSRILKRIKAIVGVTQEISELYTKFGLKVCTISNGILVTESIEPYKKQYRPQVIFVGTPGMKWHGAEKIVSLAAILPEFDFHIVGVNINEMDASPNVKFHGYLNTMKLQKLYEIIDVGIGTLSLYEKGMEEACPLKVREYLSKGIPVILGYKDVDVDGQPFVLNIGNYERNVLEHLSEIKGFVNYYYGDRIDKKLIFPLIDLRVKERERLKFIKSIVDIL